MSDNWSCDPVTPAVETKDEILTATIGEHQAGDTLRAQAGDAEAAERVLETGYRRLQAECGSEPEFAQAIYLERNGGPCPRCKKPFRKENKYKGPSGRILDGGALYWYVPACSCYMRCITVDLEEGVRVKGCGRWLVYEQFKGLHQCSACRPLRKHDEPARRSESRPIARKPYHDRNVAERRWTK